MANLEMEGKKIIVSGASGGIGTAIFYELLNEGASPIGVDLKMFQNSELARRLHDYRWKIGQDFEFFAGDASNEELMQSTLGKFETIDGLVNNAGLLGSDADHGGRSIKLFHKMMKAHAETAFVLTELAYPKMQNGGSIVNIGSIETRMAEPGVVSYAAAKGALSAMTVAYATTLAGKKIRVNMVSPGLVKTEKNETRYQDEDTKKILRHFEGRTPLGRSVDAKEVADTVLYLLSSRSSAITGQEIVVDCGYTRALYDPSWTEKK